MTLFAKIEEDYIAAYKAKNAVTLGVLRLLKSAIKNLQVELRREVTDAEVLDTVVKQCKQRQDSIDQFTAANRLDLADKEAAELEVLRLYMPAPLEGAELEAAIAAAIQQAGATGVREMGKVMQVLMADHKGRIDGKSCSDAVKNALQAM